MRERVAFTVDESMPEREAVLDQMGMAPPAVVSPRNNALLDDGYEEFRRLSEPVAVIEDVSTPEFDVVYRGEGHNSHPTPLGMIYPLAVSLVLFAATVGRAVGARIRHLFATNDPARGFILDSVASVSADRLALLLTTRIRGRFAEGDMAVLAYSPGYCGWHISAQRALFERLQPGEISIKLNDSYLMQPLKSVSGVLVAGPRRIHRFRPEFSFCESCTSRQCLPRMASVKEPRK